MSQVKRIDRSRRVDMHPYKKAQISLKNRSTLVQASGGFSVTEVLGWSAYSPWSTAVYNGRRESGGTARDLGCVQQKVCYTYLMWTIVFFQYNCIKQEVKLSLG